MDKETRNEVFAMVKAAVAETASALMAQLKNASQIPDLAAAYVAAYGEIGNVAKDSHNPHFGSNYASLAAVLDTGKPVFARHGLALLQAPGAINGDKISLMGMVLHKSGQHITITTELHIGKLTAQAAGSGIQYARRYQAAAVFGLTAVDDDGNAATEQPATADVDTTPTPKKPSGKKKDESYADAKAALLAEIEACTTIEQTDPLKEKARVLDDHDISNAYLEKRKALRGVKK